MQLGRTSRPTPSGDIPDALRQAASAYGHRPAISFLLPAGRQEQAYVSLAQWAAKTAHWLEVDLAAEPGFVLGLVGPAGWVPAAAALGAWWIGASVRLDDEASGADVVLAGPGTDRRDGWLSWGHEFDGTDQDAGDNLAWIVQEFPDDPPPARGSANSVAIADADPLTQQELLSEWAGEPTAPIGVDATGGSRWLAAAAVRPLIVGRPTVLLADGVSRERAAGDGVDRWL